MMKVFTKPDAVYLNQEDLAKVLENPITVRFGKEKVVESVKKTEDYINEAFEGAERKSRMMCMSVPRSIHHCGAGLFERLETGSGQEFLPAENLDRFIALLNSIAIYSEEENDLAKNYRVVKGILPTNYFALVDHVKLKHIPREFFKFIDSYDNTSISYRIDRYNVYDENNKLVRTDSKYNLYCPEGSPMPTNIIWPGIDKSEIISNYHCITMKIHRNDIIKSWDVGNDLDCVVYENSEDQYVKLGKFGRHKCIK